MPDYITPEGYRRMTDEYDTLLRVERPRITAEVAYAASLGDRSENAEYIYGKKRLREIDHRLRYLRQRIESLEVVDPSQVPMDRVRFGSIVEVEDEDGTRHTYRIVGEDESDPRRGRVSYQSPLGRALLGRTEGEEAVVEAPGGRRVLEVASIRYP
ncbi:MAG: transcription elongation factor GreB [Deltaproteobacteria bacterium]|nr:transcription elongation factor GreB [Deltaproteobacteria bacterium]